MKEIEEWILAYETDVWWYLDVLAHTPVASVQQAVTEGVP